MAGLFGMSYSTDLIHWDIVKEANFPPDARHGCVTILKPEEAEMLLKTFGGNE